MKMQPPASTPERRETSAQTSALQAYRQAVEGWAELHLRPYIQRLQGLSSLRDKAGKEINDAVWRTISLTPFEVLILDSPLVQRLRRIRQLGVVHWVYPSAGHSRLEHSLGAIHQVHRLCEAINRHAGEGNGLGIDWISLLRLAALVSDIGHGLMSHVIENAFKALGVADAIRLELADELGEEESSLSEVVAYFILGSVSFKNLVDCAREKTGQKLPDDWQKKLCRLVLGQPVHPRWPLLQELISGPFDAAKLDYMSRDSQSAGIPNLTDIPRLIQKVRVAELPPQELPVEIARRVTAGPASYFVQGILLSGGRTLDELMLAQTLLFDKVYRHQKNRAVEAMMANVVALLVSHLKPESVLLLPLINSDDFINLNKDTLATQLPIRDESQQHGDLVVAAELIARIRERNLFVRAYAFSHTMPHDPFRNDSQQKTGLEHVRRDFGLDPSARASVLAEIIAVTEEVLGHAIDLLPEISNSAPLKAFIALDPFGRSTKMNEIARAYLVTADRKLVRFKEDSAESPPWNNAYLMTRDIGYVFAASEYAPAVFLACEAVFRRRYGVRTPPSAIEYSKVDKQAAEAIRMRLAEKGFYANRTADLRPMPQRLNKADVDGLIKSIVSNLKSFQPYAESSEGGDTVVDGLKVLAWLRQFSTDEEIDCALQLLQGLKVLTRGEVRMAVEAFLSANPDFKGCHVCQLGGPRDSSAIITYYAQDLADRWQLKITSLQQALTEDDLPILFVDDFLGTGRQAVSIVKHWLGEEFEDRLEEDHGLALSSKQARELKRRSLGFVFVFGTTAGKDRLTDELRKSGIAAKVHVHQDEETLPKAFSGVAIRYPSLEVASRFRSRCEQIGRQLMESQGVAAEKVAERALGYGNNAYLVVFPYNVPTATLTLLWSPGKVGGIAWMPLLPRRKKK